MPEQEIDVTATTSGSVDVVWELIDNSATWPMWTAIDDCEIEREADRDEPGEIRRFRTGRYVVREEIVERRAPTRLVYVLLDGLPLRDYRAEIDLRPDGAGTAIRWHTTFAPKVPLTGWIYRMALDRTTKKFVAGLVEASDDPASR